MWSGETGPVTQASEPGCGQVMDGRGAVMGASVCHLLNRKGKGSGAKWRRATGQCPQGRGMLQCVVPVPGISSAWHSAVCGPVQGIPSAGESWVNYLLSPCLHVFICTVTARRLTDYED